MRIVFQVAGLTGALLLGAALLSGCGGPQDSAPISTAQDSAKAQQGKEPTEAQVELSLISIKDLPTQLAARKGKVVVLDMWATW